ncbi:unnamed protein product [Owenia fusiformis]|uniref:ER membrane protein complex subunit 1 n=1 Tax=Owenia fusiformis TaxID=6347 RepID=A0A8J1T6T6_OWEFU|nr:unnamed protein product [Owenia fusiformis]
MSIVALLMLALTCLTGSNHALFQDQAGTYDWRQQYVGKVIHAMFDQSTVSGKRILVATQQNVVASLFSKNGKIAWRQIQEGNVQDSISSLLHSDNSLVSLSGHAFLRNWSPTSGYLQWEVPVNGSGKSSQAIFIEDTDEQIAVTSGNTLYVISAKTGSEKLKQSLPNSESTEYGLIYSKSDKIYLVGIAEDQHVSVVAYDSLGTIQYQNTLPAIWVKMNSQCEIFGDNLVCLDTISNTVYSTPLDGKAFKSVALSDFGFEPNQPKLVALTEDNSINSFGIIIDGENAAVLGIDAAGVKVVKDLPQATAMQVSKHPETQANVLVTVGRRSSDDIFLKLYDLATGSEIIDMSKTIHVASHHGKPQKIVVQLVKRKESLLNFRLLLVSDDHSMILLQTSGRSVWVREEALASVLSVEMVDLPVSEVQAKFDDEFGSSRDDIVAMFIKRFKTQFLQLQTFILQLIDNIQGHKHKAIFTEGHEEGDDEFELTRDNFNLNKIIVAATSVGKVFGLYSSTGKIVWRHMLHDVTPFSRYGSPMLALLVQRTTAHFPHQPQCVVIGKHKVTGNGVLSVFNPITGVPVKNTPSEGISLHFQIKQFTLLPMNDDHFIKPIAILDTNNRVYLYPENKKIMKEIDNTMYMFTASEDTNTMIGYQIKQMDDELKAQEVWAANLGQDNQVITSVTAKKVGEHVHSQGLILADRSVLYKYLNPNLVAVTTEGIDGQAKPFINMYLIDTVSGHIVFSCYHRRVHGPVKLVHSENWVIYSFYNEKNRRNEISVVEMFEGSKQSNSTDFSSLHPPSPPIVMRQAFIFPFPLSTMAATVTEKGITDKHIMIALKAGGIVEVQRQFLDARRPVIPKPEHREEGIIPYIPEIPLSFEQFINYNQSVFNIRGIHTSPSGLESTSLMIAYGLDIFFTRAMPSKMFDVLKEDFDYFFIGAVLSAMILASVITKKLAERKALYRGWK